MTVSELIKRLQNLEDRDATVFVAESNYDWKDALIICKNGETITEIILE